MLKKKTTAATNNQHDSQTCREMRVLGDLQVINPMLAGYMYLFLLLI